MAQVTVRRYEVKDLPPVCARCGGPATGTTVRSFAWTPGWVYIILLADILPFLIVHIVVTKKRRVAVPLCDEHENHWRSRAVLVWGSLAGLVAVNVGAFVLADQLGPPKGNPDVTGFLCVGTIVSAFVWLGVAVGAQVTSIRAAEITDRTITLTKVAGGFADALYARRDEEEADDRDRRGRRDDDDRDRWGDDDDRGRRDRRDEYDRDRRDRRDDYDDRGRRDRRDEYDD